MSQEPTTAVAPPPTPNQREVRGYRLLFYGAVVVGLAASAATWHYKQQLAADMGVFQVMSIAQQRDQKFTFVVDNYGYKYKGESGNLIDEQIMMFGVFEKDHLYFMRDYLARAGIDKPVVIDVGANTGNHSLFLSHCAGKVHAFEPFPPVIRKFRDNLALNPAIQNIELHEVGLGELEAELPFYLPPDDNHGVGTFKGEVKKVEHRVESNQKLRVVVGDTWMQDKETGPIALVKIDVEGFEKPVLVGLQRTLAKHRPLVVVEVSPPPVGSIESLPQLAALFPEGYEFLIFDRTLMGAVKGHYSLRPLTAQMFGSGQLEVVAYPRERAAAVPR